MTRKDFIVIADMLGELAKRGFLDIEDEKAQRVIYSSLKATNPGFKEGTFLARMRKAKGDE